MPIGEQVAIGNSSNFWHILVASRLFFNLFFMCESFFMIIEQHSKTKKTTINIDQVI